MTRREFVEVWCLTIKRTLNRRVAKGEVKLSEAVMTQADAPKRAVALWRKHRKSWNLIGTTRSQFLKDMGL